MSIVYVHLPSFAVSRGLEIFDGVMLICISGIATFTSRAMFQVCQAQLFRFRPLVLCKG